MLRWLAAGTALAAALVLAGCTPPGPTETTTPAASTSASPIASPPASPSSATDEQLLTRAFDVSSSLLVLVDQGFRDGALPPEVHEFASSELIAMIEADISAFQDQGLKVTGSSALHTPSILSNARSSETDGSLVIATCWDTSGTTTTGPDGEVVSGGVTRQPRLFEIEYSAREMLVTRTGPPTDPLELPGCN